MNTRSRVNDIHKYMKEKISEINKKMPPYNI